MELRSLFRRTAKSEVALATSVLSKLVWLRLAPSRRASVGIALEKLAPEGQSALQPFRVHRSAYTRPRCGAVAVVRDMSLPREQ